MHILCKPTMLISLCMFIYPEILIFIGYHEEWNCELSNLPRNLTFCSAKEKKTCMNTMNKEIQNTPK